LDSYGPGQTVDIYRDGVLLGLLQVGQLRLDAESFFNNACGWSVDVEKLPEPSQWFEGCIDPAPDYSPWLEIGYIDTTYSPYSNMESAAIQLAIWKWIYGREFVTTSETAVETRALEIYDSAVGQTGVLPWLIKREYGGIPGVPIVSLM